MQVGMDDGAHRPMSRLADTGTDIVATATAGATLDAVPLSGPELTLTRYRMRFRRCSSQGGSPGVPFPNGYLGSAWRGAFGHALREAVCVTRLPRCDPCVLLRSCPYPFLFESRTPPGAKKLTLYPHTPGPYVLEPWDPRFDTGREEGGLDLGLILFGSANDHLPYAVHALDRAARRGLTTRRVSFELRCVQAESRGKGGGGRTGVESGADADTDTGTRDSHGIGAGGGRGIGADGLRDAGGGDHGTGPRDACATDGDWITIFEPSGPLSPVLPESPPVPAAPRFVRVRLLTPLRIRRDERLVTASGLSFRMFAGHLLRRISLLTYFFAETPLEIDFAELLGQAESMPVAERRLRWHEWTRHSSRQNAKVPMGGLVGSFGLEGPALARFWPYLWLGQWTHVGKGCSMGLGRYVLEPMEAPDRTRPAHAPSAIGGWPGPRRL